MYRLTSKRLDRITKQERARLNLLTLKGSNGWTSMMREDILWRKKALHRIQLFLVRDSDGTIIAWSCTKPSAEYCYIYTYVMSNHRRKGLGTRLFNRALSHVLKQSLIPRIVHSSQNVEFFETVAPKENIRVDHAGY